MIFFILFFFIYTTNYQYCQAQKLGHVVLQWLLRSNSTSLFLIPVQKKNKRGGFWGAGTTQQKL